MRNYRHTVVFINLIFLFMEKQFFSSKEFFQLESRNVKESKTRDTSSCSPVYFLNKLYPRFLNNATNISLTSLTLRHRLNIVSRDP